MGLLGGLSEIMHAGFLVQNSSQRTFAVALSNMDIILMVSVVFSICVSCVAPEGRSRSSGWRLQGD